MTETVVFDLYVRFKHTCYLQWKGNAASGSCKLLTMDPAIKIYGISPNLAVNGLAPLTGRAVLAGAQPRLELGTFSRALADYAARRQK